MSISNQMRAANWAELYPRLLAYAARCVRSKTWRGATAGRIPGALEATDFVQMAVQKTMSGRRAWDQKNKTLQMHLMDVIKSDISNHSRSKENKITGAFSDLDLEFIESQNDLERDIINRWLVERFILYVRAIDPSLVFLAERRYLEGITNPIELSKIEGLDVDEIKKKTRKIYELTRKFADGVRGELEVGDLSIVKHPSTE